MTAARGALRRDLTTLPNLITLARLVLIAGALGAHAAGLLLTALLLGATAGATDYLDGWVARRTGQVTRLGEILDQFCDVAVEVVVLLLAVSYAAVPAAALAPYVLREVWVAAIRRSAASLGANVPSRLSGKVKSAFLGWSAVPLFLGAVALRGHPAAGGLVLVGTAALYVGLALSLWSGARYTLDYARIYDRT
jgi:CDP-diacylglycerol--glycerol-3-phosphate 3-phosphatidyltransferase